MFANGPEDQGSIPGWVIPKTQKIVLDATLLSAQPYKLQIKVKWSNLGERVAPSPTPWCSSKWKGSLLLALDHGRYLIYIYIYICDNTPPADPHYLNQPNYSWPLESSSGFSNLRPGFFHISLLTCKICNRGGRRKEEQTIGLGLAPSARGEVCDTFMQLSVHLQAIEGMYLRETSTKPLGILTHLALVKPASVGQ